MAVDKIQGSIIPYDHLIRALCATPYYGHAKGCPNLGCKDGCPPLPLVDAIFDLNREMYVIFTSYTVGMFATKMKHKHQEWEMGTYPDHPKRTRQHVQAIQEHLKRKHPAWPNEYYAAVQEQKWKSSRQWYNPRRWQSIARKEHNEEIKQFQNTIPNIVVDTSPEARGVNLTGLMYELGIKLDWQWPPEHKKENTTYQISLAGYRKQNN